MRLRSKSAGGWVGCVGACIDFGGSSNHTHILKIIDMTITSITSTVLYFFNVTYRMTITAYIARIQGFHYIIRIVIIRNNHLSCDYRNKGKARILRQGVIYSTFI